MPEFLDFFEYSAYGRNFRRKYLGGSRSATVKSNALIRVLEPKKRRQAMAGDYFMLSLDVPSVLVECGFLSNPEERELLSSPSYQTRVAAALFIPTAEFLAETLEKE